jgi:hypothetical protein
MPNAKALLIQVAILIIAQVIYDKVIKQYI